MLSLTATFQRSLRQGFRRNCLFLAEIIPTIVVIVLDIHFDNHNRNVVLDSFAKSHDAGKGSSRIENRRVEKTWH
jgi:hypothetical protein